jgi:hypothetical protein
VWLAAVIGVPILFNPRAINNGFGPYKLGLLRALALIGLAAWLVHIVDTSGLRSGIRRFFMPHKHSRLVQALGFLLLSVVASTLFSIDRCSSFWGAYETSEGLLTWVAGFVLLGLVANFLRSRPQMERLVTGLMAASFAVSVLTIIQRLGYDPRFPLLAGGRSFGTAGNPIYLGGYLLMVCPLTLWRTWSFWNSAKAHGTTLPRIQAACCTLVLIAQMAALYCAGSRGPALGLATALFVFVSLLAAKKRMPVIQWLLRGLTVAGCATALVVFAVGASQKTSGSAAPGISIPFIGGDSGRAEVWAHAPSLIAGRKAVQFPIDGMDRFHWLRVWLGYGPETLDHVLPQHYSISENASLTVNRFHNLFWDHGFSLGLVGVLAFLAVVLISFFSGYQALGLIPSLGASVAFWSVVLGLGACTCVFLSNALGLGFAGLGLVLGLAVGLALYAVWAAYFVSARSPDTSLGSESYLLAALLSSLAGHLVDMAFAFETALTFTLLFLYLGLLLALLQGRPASGQLSTEARSSEAKVPNQTSKSDASKLERQDDIAASLLIGFGLVTLFFSFCHQYSTAPFEPFALLRSSFLNWSGTQGPHSLTVLSVMAFWIIGCLLLVNDVSGSSIKQNAMRLLFVFVVSGILGLGYAAVEIAMIAGTGPLPLGLVAEGKALDQAGHYANIYLNLMAWLLLLVVLAGCWLSNSPVAKSKASNLGRLAATVFGLSAVVAIWPLSVGPLRSDVVAQWGSTLENFGRGDLAAGVYERAIAQNPRLFAYRPLLANNLMDRAQASTDATAVNGLLSRAETTLLEANEFTDLNRASYFLGLVYSQWALHEISPPTSTYGEKASAAFGRAQIFEPFWEPVWRENAVIDMALGRKAEAQAKISRADELGKPAPLVWAEYYDQLARQCRNPKLSRQYIGFAFEYYDSAILRYADNAELLSRSHGGKGKLLLASGQCSEAITSLLEAAKYEGIPDRWQLDIMLAQAYAQISDVARAQQHLEQALFRAPPDQRDKIRQCQAELRRP